MGLPAVKLEIENGGLGKVVTTAEGVAGLVVPAVATGLLPLYTPTQIFSLKEAEALGLTEAFDATQKIDAWRQVADFYSEAGNGAELWVMTTAYTKTMTELFDPNTTTNGIRKLLDAAGGKIRILACGRYIDPTKVYTPTIQGGMDADAINALQKANALALEYMYNYKPFVAIVDGRGWNGIIADLVDLRTYTYPKATLMVGTNVLGKKSAAVGIALGRLARLPVQRNIARVKDGGLNIANGYLTDGREIAAFSDAQIEAIHNKGYLLFRRWVGLAGVYFVDDPTATVPSDDYLTISNNRVMHKAIVIAYSTYLQEVNDEVSITADGKINPAQIAYYKQKINNALKLNMLDEGNVSSVDVTIDSTQNVISTDEITFSLRAVPVAYGKNIVLNMGFQNPALTS